MVRYFIAEYAGPEWADGTRMYQNRFWETYVLFAGQWVMVSREPYTGQDLK
jgi:hypothetical protein